MNLKIVFVALFVVLGTVMVQAQGQRRTVEERVKRVTDTLTTVFNLEKSVLDQTGVVFTDYYKEMDKLREATGQGTPDRTQMQALQADRDEKLKKILTEDQFKKFKDEIEPALRPRRRQG